MHWGCESMGGTEHKIIISGSVGAGKTTAVGMLSTSKVVSTEAHNSDQSVSKLKTTVAMDYGEVSLGNGDRLRLYGTPGQQRFDYMWKMLSKGCLGLIILIDNKEEAFKELEEYLKVFKTLIETHPCVIGISKYDKQRSPNIDQYYSFLRHRHLKIPVFSIDARCRKNIFLLVETLLSQIELSTSLILKE